VNGVAVGAVARVRRAVERPSARAGLVVAALAWVLTRAPMYSIDAGLLRDRWRPFYIGDVVRTYENWLPLFAHGRFPHADVRWQYPPGATAILRLPQLVPGSYLGSFLRIELLCDLLITAMLVHMAIRRGSWLGCWCWIAGIVLIGPVALGRFDIFATLFAVAALYLADSPWRLGALAGLGAVVKVWPALILFGVRPGNGRKAVTAAIASAGAVIAGYLAFTSGSLSFLANQNSRGIEIESIAAQPFTVLRTLGIWHGHVAWRYGAYQVVGPGVGVAAGLTLAGMLLALAALVWWRWLLSRRSWQPEMAGDTALAATLLIVTTSKVISVQYMIWLIGMAACALAYPRTSQRPVAVGLLFVAGLTQVEYPFLFDDFRIYGAAAGTAVVALRDAMLLAFTVLAIVRLWRSARRPGDVASPGVMPSEQELHGPRAERGFFY
jgi:Glycosyltransferase family 87